MVKKISSRERLSAALACQKTDYVPCSFMIFFGLRDRCKDYFEFVDRQLEMGLDARVDISDLLVKFHPDVHVREWKETIPNEPHPLLCKEYHTPAGVLRTEVWQTEDWPYGDHVPFMDDYLAVRTRKYLVTRPEDLPALRYLLAEPGLSVIEEYRQRAEVAKQFARSRDILLCGGGCNFERVDVPEVGHECACVGIDALMWFCGAEAPLIWAFEQPEFLGELINIVALWNRRRMEITLDAGVDLLIKRAWYEGTEFWSPALYRRFIAPILVEDANLVHQAGAKFGYIITSGMMDLVDDLLKIKPDAIIGIDPVQGKGTELNAVQQKINSRLCLWGGTNGCLTMETGTKEQVKAEVEKAIDILGRNNGFILSPVDNVREMNPQIEENVRTFIETWKSLRSKP
ncbi:MAG: uroporphyrinogen decarboxylase family protein [Phycisphaerae bacterium]